MVSRSKYHRDQVPLNWSVFSYLMCLLMQIRVSPISFSAVQVNSADQHLRVFDPALRRWRQVCSSPANDLLASISCEEVGFVRWAVLTVISAFSCNVLWWKTKVCVCSLKCGELLSHLGAGGQWRWWGVLLCQTGGAQPWQENQRLIVPVVRDTPVFDAAPVPRQFPLSHLLLLLPLSSTHLHLHGVT